MSFGLEVMVRSALSHIGDLIAVSLSKRPNFLLTPHVAWASDEAMQTLVDMAMDKITSFIDKR
ncbi:hypothetical protein [Marinomonas foliarum]|uniref:Uncharacterized protein n=1 Tax=Marinomonas foliarum TaxID=491950 RepID=A0A368ZD64_9GAMM|nr:hypothetical protein [Marinomonas foliarum]RCW91180.1 hypothetical protein DFP77_16210 [Marinomonas foliarum]